MTTPPHDPARVRRHAHAHGRCDCETPLPHGHDLAARAHGCRCAVCDKHVTVLALEHDEITRQEGRGDVKAALMLAADGALLTGYLGLGALLLNLLPRLGWWALLVAVPLGLALVLAAISFHDALIHVKPVQGLTPRFGRAERAGELEALDDVGWYRERLANLGPLLDGKFRTLYAAVVEAGSSLILAGVAVFALALLMWGEGW